MKKYKGAVGSIKDLSYTSRKTVMFVLVALDDGNEDEFFPEDLEKEIKDV